MNHKIKEQWVKALRSGEYSQGAGRLYDPEENSFCCLGVLCDLYIKDHSMSTAWSFGPSVDEEAINAWEGYLPGEVVDWAELQASISGDLVVYQDDGTAIELTELNDAGASFQRIARYIESSIDSKEEEWPEDNSSFYDDDVSAEERNACDLHSERCYFPYED
jgi:hypothetical protein